MDQTFDGLAAFLAVGKLKSFTAAAAELSITPTAMSQKIKQLERRLDVVLFQRTTRSVALTESGERLYERLRPALAEVEDAISDVGTARGRPAGRLRLTAPRTTAWLLSTLLTRMRKEHPEIALEVSLDDAFVDLVASGFDAGIRLGDAVEKDMIRVPITKQAAWSIVGAPAYFKRVGRPERPEDLPQHQVIRQRMIATGVVYRWELERRGKPITVDVPGGVTVDDVGLMVALAREGVGLAYVPDEQIVEDLAKKRLERVLTSFMSKGPGLCLYFPSRTQTQPKLRALIEVATSVGRGA